MIGTVSRGVFLAVCLMVGAGLAQAAPQYAALVMDARTGKVIKAVNADTRVYPASLTKMMTLYIVFDEVQHGRLSLDQKVTISKHAASEPPSKLGLRPGQQIELRYLIRAAAVKSANDAATALGETVAGSEEAFAARMDAYARAMGMSRTTFKNANGLTRAGHMSTARDMATLGRRLVYDFPQYYNIFGRTSTSAGIKTVRNTNRRVLEAYQGADGIKTGYTSAAGFNLVSSAQRGDRRVIVAVLGGRSNATRNAEAMKLMDYGFDHMPRVARVQPLPPINMTLVASAAPQRGSASASASATATAASLALRASEPPLPRALDDEAITRSGETLAAAIAEVNSEVAAAQTTRSASMATLRAGRPMPRPVTAAQLAAAAPAAAAGSPSTFAVAQAVARERREESVTVASNAGTTGGNDWGVQLGAYRAKGDAERQLLTTALKDVPELSGGLRRVQAANVQGVTIYRAQFVGLGQSDALGACATLARMQSDCLPLAPGI